MSYARNLLFMVLMLMGAGFAWAQAPADAQAVNVAGAIPGALPGAVAGGVGRMDSSTKVATQVVPGHGAGLVAPGADVVLAVVLDHQAGWHVHTNAPVVPPELGDASMYIATSIAVEAEGFPGEVHVERVQWPEPHEIEVAFTGTPVRYAVFEGRAVAYVPVTIDADAAPGTYTLRFKLTYQACDDKTCLRPVFDQAIELPITVGTLEEVQAQPPKSSGDIGTALDNLFRGFDGSVFREIRAGVAAPSAEDPANVPASTSTDQRLVVPFVGSYDLSSVPAWVFGLLMVLIALAGGLLLNFTPCVLPIIPIKVLTLAQSSGGLSRRLLLAGVMCGGLVAFWLSIGGLMAGVQKFQAVNQLFQYGWFGIAVGVFIAVMAVGMMGLFTISLPRFVYAVNPTSETLPGAFVYGIMTAVLATPCAGPFMGSAIGWATQLGAVRVLLVFGAIGVGMALPYFVLAAFPKLVNRLPRTGPGSELLKQVMGLLLLSAAAFFIGTGVNSTLADGTSGGSTWFWVPVGLLLAAAGGWLAWRSLRIAGNKPAGVGFAGFGALLLLSGLWLGAGPMLKQPGDGIAWVYYTDERFEQALAGGDVVVMEFTADWCLNCKVLEATVLESGRVRELLAQDGVTPIKVDITSDANVEGNAMLDRLNRHTIPLLAVFKPDGEPVFVDDFYTIEQVVHAVAEAKVQREQ